MSIKKIEEEKNNKIFKKLDLIVYLVIALVVISLFLAIVVPNKAEKVDSIIGTIDDTIIFEYSYSKDSIEYFDKSFVEAENEANSVTISISSKYGHNVLFIDKIKREAKIISADCSVSKDCTYMIIKNINDGIVCVPHHLIIKPKTNIILNPSA